LTKKINTKAKTQKYGQKWSEMFRQMVQMSRGIPTPNCLTKNGEICQKMAKRPKNSQGRPKMRQK